MTRRISRRELLKQGALATAAIASAPLDALAFMKKRHGGVMGAADGAATIAQIPPAAIQQFSASLRGRLMLPGSAAYESARAVYASYQPSNKRPALIVSCSLAADVAAAIEFARRYELPASVRGGGHDVLGASVCDGGLVIDLSEMKRVRSDPNRGIVHADAGLTAGDLDRATGPVGFATVTANCPAVGIAGFTLGGGLGWLSGKYGAGCDNLLAAEVVTADAKVVTASKDENPDLFWAIRGGGGNFGVATSLSYRLHPVDQVFGGTLTYPMTKLGAILKIYRAYMNEAPDTLAATVYAPARDGRSFGVVLCDCGAVNSGKRLLRQGLRQYGRPLANTVRGRHYAELSTIPEFTDAAGRGVQYARSGYLETLSDGAVDAIVTAAWKSPSRMCRISLDHYVHGAVCRTPAGETAFDLREPGGITYRLSAGWRDESVANSALEWANQTWKTLQPFAGGKGYINYLCTEDEADLKGIYGANYARLAQLKRQYDPDNFFRFNRNIKPAPNGVASKPG
jgi:hypothetical protein